MRKLDRGDFKLVFTRHQGGSISWKSYASAMHFTREGQDVWRERRGQEVRMEGRFQDVGRKRRGQVYPEEKGGSEEDEME